MLNYSVIRPAPRLSTGKLVSDVIVLVALIALIIYVIGAMAYMGKGSPASSAFKWKMGPLEESTAPPAGGPAAADSKASDLDDLVV
jgi:hypothetical protein